MNPLVRRSSIANALPAAIIFSLVALNSYADDKKKPEPPKDPVARAEYCAALPEEERREIKECKTQAERDEDDQKKRIKEIEDRERGNKSSFFRKFMIDGLWVPMSGGGQYGLIGTHLDVASVGRLHLFGPPGVLMVMEKTENGGSRLRPAWTWGVSIYLIEFEFPGSNGRRAQMFFNLAKSWSAGDARAGRDLCGLSLAWKK
jgi:hypothetical protein